MSTSSPAHLEVSSPSLNATSSHAASFESISSSNSRLLAPGLHPLVGFVHWICHRPWGWILCGSPVFLFTCLPPPLCARRFLESSESGPASRFFLFILSFAALFITLAANAILNKGLFKCIWL
ncbi:hypothetical protein ASPVEDRAFT_845843 [Aspergillus versicolor CBS 583.65]|uniref:Uncharacterized protein n=1 Tax=Aspergillus versicolor CBS 583.65 TaxID=1036611 RepID=A0A1L9PV33_ASPVE|nr:uncharacterized protein ASPVEDRAFT_845843 [Aspergillus versicolor CBS 583.65]OJJ05409.1 hypothetical protein ASPVEDRAFT_845843 [Aspergillus versicolor CBS 583.65]